MVKVLGIDEAGRGPIIGPLIIAGVLIDEKESEKLTKGGIKDSKLILKKKREQLFKKIKKDFKYKIIKVEPKEIDDIILNSNHNLNDLEAMKAAEIINELKPDKAIVDCPSPNTSKWNKQLKSMLDFDIELITENKADENYPVVGAASILAKVTRDNEIEKIKKKYGDVGPGYPSNEITKKFVKENFDKHPEIFRKSWATFKNAKKEKEQSKLNDF